MDRSSIKSEKVEILKAKPSDPISNRNSGVLSYIQIEIDGRIINAFVDTGASVSVMNESTYRSMSSLKSRSLEPIMHDSVISVLGEPIDILGSLDVSITIAKIPVQHRFMIARGIKQSIILGWDFMVANEMNIVMSESCVSIRDRKVSLLSKEQVVPVVCSALMAETIVVPPNSEMIIPLKVVNDDNSDEVISGSYEGILEPDTHEDVLIARVATISRNGIIPVMVMNLSNEERTLYENTPMGCYHSTIDNVGEVYNIMYQMVQENPLAEISVNEETHSLSRGIPYPPIDLSNSNLDSNQKGQVQSLLEEYDDVFCKHTRDYGRTDLIRHKIELTESNSPKQSSYRTSPKLREVMREKVDELLEDNLIEPSISSFAAPALLVRKKSPDGSQQYRFVVDFRKTNLITLKDAQSLPRIDDSIDALHGNSYFSVIDLASGFWQVEMEHADREITAFTTGDRLYQWKVMPMGLKNSSGTFQRLMELVFHGMHWTKVCFFIDDIIIFGRTFDEKMRNMREVFERLRQAGLKARPDKCQIFCKTVTFLGHVVSDQGVKPDVSNIEKVKNWPRPNRITSLRGWLGLTGFYRRFIKNYAQIAQPLLHLTKKGVPFDWTDDCEQAFVMLRHALISPPILTYPNFNESFILNVDASAFAVGAVLAQNSRKNGEQVIAYASHSLTISERKWSTYDRELWAIVWSIRHFKHYLQASQFTIVTDHKPLMGLRKMPLDNDPTGRRARWAMEIELLDWTIEYKMGSKHINADAMSRREIQVKEVSSANCTKGPRPKLNAALVNLHDERNLNMNGHIARPTSTSSLVEDPLTVNEPVKLKGDHTPQGDVLRLCNSGKLDHEKELDDAKREQGGISEIHSTKESDTSLNEGDMFCNASCSLEKSGTFSLANDVHRLRDMQNQDVDICEVLSWLRKGYHPTRSQLRNKPKLQKYRRVYRHLVVQNHVLWRRYKQVDKSVIYQAVVPSQLVPKILEQLHGSDMVGHYGVQKTVQKALQLYFWPLMYRDILRYCRSCDICQRDKNPVPKFKAPLKTMVATRPFQIVAADIVEFGLTSSGNRYLLVITDYFTKYVNMYTLQRQTADAVAECIFEKYIRQHSIPEQIQSDQGKQFEAEITQSLCERLGILKSRTSPMHPESDGQTERMNRTIRAQLVRNILSHSARDWDKFIPYLEFTYNTTVHSSTGFSPFYMLHARQPRLPSEVMYGSYKESEQNESDVQTRVRQMCNRYNAAAQLVQSNNKKAKQQQKRQYDKRVRFRPYKIGEMVYINNPKSVRSKLTPRWIGPFQVIQEFNDGLNYQIIDPMVRAAKPKVIHYNRMKPKCDMYHYPSGSNNSSSESSKSPEETLRKEVIQDQVTQSHLRRLRRRSRSSGQNQQNQPNLGRNSILDSPMSLDRRLALQAARQLVLNNAAAAAAPNVQQNVRRSRYGREVKPPVRLGY